MNVEIKLLKPILFSEEKTLLEYVTKNKKYSRTEEFEVVTNSFKRELITKYEREFHIQNRENLSLIESYLNYYIQILISYPVNRQTKNKFFTSLRNLIFEL